MQDEEKKRGKEVPRELTTLSEIYSTGKQRRRKILHPDEREELPNRTPEQGLPEKKGITRPVFPSQKKEKGNPDQV